MPSEQLSVIRLVLLGVVPYPDPIRRRRARTAARRLITCTPWPGDDAEPVDVAQLALLRLLWLQRETHRAARRKETEAAALLARACIETCIAGLYWLNGEDRVGRMRGDNARSFQRVVSYLADGNLITSSLVDEIAASISPPEQLPTVREMAKVVAVKTGERFATDVYDRLYVPLSTFYPHPSGLALLRHVRSDNGLAVVPMRVWSSRSAAHTADACMARLAIAVARGTGSPATPFASYANAHMSRSVAPVATMVGRQAFRGMRLSKLGSMVRALVSLRRYYDSGEAARDEYPERRARTRSAFSEMLELLGSDVPEPQRDLVLDYFADALAKPDRDQVRSHG